MYYSKRQIWCLHNVLFSELSIMHACRQFLYRASVWTLHLFIFFYVFQKYLLLPVMQNMIHHVTCLYVMYLIQTVIYGTRRSLYKLFSRWPYRLSLTKVTGKLNVSVHVIILCVSYPFSICRNYYLAKPLLNPWIHSCYFFL